MKGRYLTTTDGTNPWSSVILVSRNAEPSYDGDRKTFEVMTSN